jgi:hypothetical protein
MAGFKKFRLSKFGFKVPLFKFVSYFKFRAENLRNSPGHTIHPIERKLGVLPILVIQNHRKIQKIESKSKKNWISTSASAS